MKNKMISSTIIHVVLLIVVCFVCIFSFFKIYNYILDDSVKEEEKNYIRVQTDNYLVECLDFYFNTKFRYGNRTYEVYYPNTYLILRLRITNTSKESITLSNDYKVSFGDIKKNFDFGFNKNKLNIEPGKNVISNVACFIEYDENIKEYIVDFDGKKMKLVFE